MGGEGDANPVKLGSVTVRPVPVTQDSLCALSCLKMLIRSCTNTESTGPGAMLCSLPPAAGTFTCTSGNPCTNIHEWTTQVQHHLGGTAAARISQTESRTETPQMPAEMDPQAQCNGQKVPARSTLVQQIQSVHIETNSCTRCFSVRLGIHHLLIELNSLMGLVQGLQAITLE